MCIHSMISALASSLLWRIGEILFVGRANYIPNARSKAKQATKVRLIRGFCCILSLAASATIKANYATLLRLFLWTSIPLILV